MRFPEKYFHLPYPPTANTLFANGKKGRYRTKNYESWLTEAGLVLNSHHIVPYDNGVWIDLQIHRPDKRKRDLDNLCKPIFDLLVKHKVVKDDSLIVGFSTKWVGQGDFVWFRIRNAKPLELKDSGLLEE